MKAWLEMVDSGHHEIAVTATLGRARTNSLSLEGEAVSRRHALVHRQGEGEYWLVDLGSRNGTQLNGRRLVEPQRLKDGDVLEIGSHRLIFRCVAAGPSPTPSPATSEATASAVKLEKRVLLVADIRGFTDLSQALPVEELALGVGEWFGRCRELVERSGGVVNKYLGDGFFATWGLAKLDTGALRELVSGLGELQSRANPPFRWVVHYGELAIGPSQASGEEPLIGPAVNFVFRMEKVAARMGQDRLWSEQMVGFLGEEWRFETCGESVVAGFPGRHVFYRDVVG